MGFLIQKNAATKQDLYEEARRVVINDENQTVVLEATGPFWDDLNIIVKYCKAITLETGNSINTIAIVLWHNFRLINFTHLILCFLF